MTTHGSVTQLVADLRSDDAAVSNRAAQLIWDRYFGRLLELARNHLDRQIRRRVDEEDVLQSMYKSFCLRRQRGEFDLANRDALWGLLAKITLNKTRNAAKHELRGKRNINLERSIPVDDDAESDRRVLEQMESTEPSPEQAAILKEVGERWQEALADADLQQIRSWLLEGYSYREIADKLGCVERTVQRKVALIRDTLRSVG
jgi:DNA-directed RNA polymerase specialized sigma24 family protein